MANTVKAPASGRLAASIKLMVAALATSLLAGCGETAVCSKPEVLDTVKKLFEEQQFGKFIQLPGVAVLKEKSATFQSSNKETNIARCSVIVAVDLLQMLKLTQGYSDEQLAKLKASAEQNGQETLKDNLVNYTVQTMASGENYITVLP